MSGPRLPPDCAGKPYISLELLRPSTDDSQYPSNGVYYLDDIIYVLFRGGNLDYGETPSQTFGLEPIGGTFIITIFRA